MTIFSFEAANNKFYRDVNVEAGVDAPVKQDKTEESATNDKKRAREDDGDVKEQPEAKKQVVESEAS